MDADTRGIAGFMIRWNVLTVFPESFSEMVSFGVLGQALEKKIIELAIYNPREDALDAHKSVDDKPYGGTDGMVMKADVLDRCFRRVQNENAQTKWIYLSPQGSLLNERKVLELSGFSNVSLVCGRYGGIDQRVLNRWPIEEISVGDYVISGGELAAAILMDACSRKVPGVLGHAQSASCDSLAGEGWLEAPLYTRPAVWNQEEVPMVLTSGHHENIERWQKGIGMFITAQKRPEIFQTLWQNLSISERQKKAIDLKKTWEQLGDSERKILGLRSDLWEQVKVYAKS